MQDSAGPRYRDSAAYAIAAVVALAAGAIVDAGILAFVAKHSSDTAPMPEWIGKLQWIVRAGVACAFLTWFDGAYANVIAICGKTNYDRWWAIAGFFVPPFAVFRPCEMTVEMWRRTSRRDDAPIVVYIWWAFFLQMIVTVVLNRPVMSHLLAIVAAGLAIAMIQTLNGHIDAAHLVAQREERRMRQEMASRAPRVVAPEPAPAQTTGGIAPHLAAIEAAAAQRAAERRANASWTARAPQPIAPQPIAPIATGEAVEPLQTFEPMPVVTMERPVAAPRISVPAAKRVSTERATPDVIWTRVLALIFASGGVAMLAVAANVAFNADVVSRVLAASYAGAGFVILCVAAFVSRMRVKEEATRWAMITLAGAAVVIANIIAIAAMVNR